MQDLNDKVIGGELTAAEWNEVPSELQNVIEASGQTLSSGDLTQLRKASCLILANIAALRGVAAGMGTVIINGHTTDGDGGGGDFYWDSTSTETDNGGTIIKATAITTGRWKRLYSGAVNIKWFGAKGDNSTDDSAAIQASLDASKQAYIPSGIFISDPIVPDDDHYIFGDGADSVLKLKDNTDSSFILGTSKTKIHLNNFKIDGNKANNTSGSAILWETVTYSIIQNLWIDNSIGNSVSFNHCDKNIISNNLITNDTNQGIQLGTNAITGGDPSEDNLVIGNMIVDCGGDGIYIDYSSARNKVIGNTIINSGRYAIIIDQSEDTLIQGNIIKGCASHSIIITNDTVNGTSERNVINGNKIFSSGNTGIHVDGSAGTVRANIVTNNTILNSSLYAIQISDADYTTVEGNTMESTSQHGMLINNADFNVISGNTIKDASTQTNNTYNAIVLAGTSDRNIVSGNTINQTDTNKAIYNIRLESSVSNNIISGNQVNGAVTAQISNASTTSKVFDNFGHTTKNTGTASIVNGSTIAHGLAGTPTFATVEPTVARRTTAVTAVDGTNITVAFYDDAGAAISGAENVYWKASLE